MSRNSSEGRGPLQACISELLQAFSCNIRAKVKLCVLCGEMLLRTVETMKDCNQLTLKLLNQKGD
jgi:hypothetical protein